MFLMLVLGQVATAMLGSVVDKAAGGVTDATVAVVTGRLRAGKVSLPENHDLERAHRSSLRSALRFLLASVLPAEVGRPPRALARWWAGLLKGRPVVGAGYGKDVRHPAVQWVRRLEELLEDDAWLDSWSLGTLGAHALERIASADADASRLDAFHETVADAIEAAQDVPAPAGFDRALRNGWMVADDRGSSEPITLYGAYCLFFQDRIARDATVARKVEMNSRAMLAERHEETLEAVAASATLDQARVAAAVRVGIGPAAQVLTDRLEIIEHGVGDVAISLAAQSATLDRIDARTERIEASGTRIEESSARMEAALSDSADTAAQTLGAVTEIAALVTDLHVRGRSVSAQDVEAILVRYRDWMIETTRWLRTEARAAGGEALRLPLRDLWVGDMPLVRRASEEHETQEGRETFPASEVLYSGSALITGGPGSGKSTMLRWMAHIVAEHPFEPLPPVLISCRALRGDALHGGVEALVDHALRGWGALNDVEIEQTAAVLARAVLEGRAVLAVDGLDEIADGGARLGFAESLSETVAAHPAMRLLVTTRAAGSGPAITVLSDGLRSAAQSKEGAAATEPQPGSDPAPTRTRERTPVFEIAPLGSRHRVAFLATWGTMRGLDEAGVQAAYGPLLREVSGSGDVALLAENVFMLSLLAHAQDQEREVGSRSLPVRRRELFRRVVEYRVDGQRGLEPRLTVDEVVPRLEHLALRMVRDGELQLTEAAAVAVLTEFDEAADVVGFPSVSAVRSPVAVLDAVRSLGLLASAGPGPTRRGIAQQRLQFFHQSFAEYFAGNGLVHRWCEAGTVLQEMAELAQGCRSGAAPLSPTLIECVRHGVDRLDAQQLESLWFGIEPEVAVAEVLELWLPPGTASEAGDADDHEGAATAVAVAMLGLAACSEMTVPEQVAASVLDAAVARAGGSESVTAAAGELMRTPWAELAVSRYSSLTGGIARRWATTLMSGMSPLDVDETEVETAIAERLASILEGSGALRARALMELTELFYELQTASETPSDGDDEEPRADQRAWAPGGVGAQAKDACWELLLPLAESDDPMARLGAWALVWLTCAPRPLGDRSWITPDRLSRVQRILRTSPLSGPRDEWLVADLATLVGMTGATRPLYAELDWIMLIAKAADGVLPRRSLPFLLPQGKDEDAEWLIGLLPAHRPAVSARIATAVNRLGAYPASAIDALWWRVCDDSAYNDERDEALFGVLQVGGERVVTLLAEALQTAADGSYLALRAPLGLVAVGDLATLERLAEPGPHYDSAYLYALAGHQDPRGRAAVESIAADHADAGLRADAADVLEVARGWAVEG